MTIDEIGTKAVEQLRKVGLERTRLRNLDLRRIGWLLGGASVFWMGVQVYLPDRIAHIVSGILTAAIATTAYLLKSQKDWKQGDKCRRTTHEDCDHEPEMQG